MQNALILKKSNKLFSNQRPVYYGVTDALKILKPPFIRQHHLKGKTSKPQTRRYLQCTYPMMVYPNKSIERKIHVTILKTQITCTHSMQAHFDKARKPAKENKFCLGLQTLGIRTFFFFNFIFFNIFLFYFIYFILSFCLF